MEPGRPGSATFGSDGITVKWTVTVWAGLKPSSIVAVSVYAPGPVGVNGCE